jgi:hypothetical protein
MYRLSDEMPFVNLALSLHAPNQDVRIQIVPAARAHPIEKLLDAVDYHIEQNRKLFEQGFQGIDCPGTTNVTTTVTTIDKRSNANKQQRQQQRQEQEHHRASKTTGCMIEYILIHDVNDKDEHAHELAKLLQSRREHVLLNLIPYNPTEVAEDYLPPTDEQVQSFHQICISEPYKIHCRVRQEKGQDIAGACGQLALVSASKKGQGQGDHSNGEKGNDTKDLEDMHSSTHQQHQDDLSNRGASSNRGKRIVSSHSSSSTVDTQVTAEKSKFCGMLVKANVLVAIALAASSAVRQKMM